MQKMINYFYKYRLFMTKSIDFLFYLCYTFFQISALHLQEICEYITKYAMQAEQLYAKSYIAVLNIGINTIKYIICKFADCERNAT